MARIPDTFIDDLLARTDLVALIGSRVALTRKGKEHTGCCPFHDERTPSFTVNSAKQFYHCFGCGAHGNAIRFLTDHERMDFRAAVEHLAGIAGVAMPSDTRPVAPIGALAALYGVNAIADTYYRAQLAANAEAAGYIALRGLTAETCETFGVGFAPDAWDTLKTHLGPARMADGVKAGLLSQSDSGRVYDKFRGRVMFPIHDRRGRVIAFGGRVIGDAATPKYLNSPETELFHKGNELYGLWHARQANAQLVRLVVVEGYFDVAMLHQHGITEAVATSGTALTAAQAELLFRTANDAIFCFDGDRAGRAAAAKAAETVLPFLSDGRQATFLFLPDGEDPDSLVRREGGEAFRSRLASATPLSEFLFAELGRDIDLSSLEGKARLAGRAAPVLARLPAGAFVELMRQRLADLTGLRPAPTEAAPGVTAASPANTPRASSVRVAITALLHHPACAGAVALPRLFSALQRPGVALLVDMIVWLQAHPDAGTAEVLAAFSDRPEADALATLAALPCDNTDHDRCALLLQALGRLDQQARRRRIEALQQRAQLPEHEKRELIDLLAMTCVVAPAAMPQTRVTA